MRGFLDFQLAAAITQSTLLGGVTAGIATALEIEGGFFDRLATAPVPRAAIVVGRLIATAILAIFQVLWFLVIGADLRRRDRRRRRRARCWSSSSASSRRSASAAIGMTLAFRARNASTVQGIFPIVFVILFLSSAFFPRELLQAPSDWLADVNPLSYIAEGMRDPIVSGISAGPVLLGIAAGAAARVRVRRAGRRLDARKAAQRMTLAQNLAVIGALSRRALNEILRVPGGAIPGVLAPTIFMIGLSGVFGAARADPGVRARTSARSSSPSACSRAPGSPARRPA